MLRRLKRAGLSITHPHHTIGSVANLVKEVARRTHAIFTAIIKCGVCAQNVVADIFVIQGEEDSSNSTSKTVVVVYIQKEPTRLMQLSCYIQKK